MSEAQIQKRRVPGPINTVGEILTERGRLYREVAAGKIDPVEARVRGDLLKAQREDIVAAEFLPVLEDMQRIVAQGEQVTSADRERFLASSSKLLEDNRDRKSAREG